MKTKTITTILFIILSLSIAFSQSINKPKLDSFLDILSQKNKAMGSLAISKNGIVLYSKAIGYSLISDTEKKPSSVITKYRIGSISKMFTAGMIFQLIEAGKLQLTTTLDNYFVNIPNAKKITISNLLNHRSGLHNFTADLDYTTWMTQGKTQSEMVAIISKYKVDFEPNEKFSYSNSNYLILGYIIEKITKKSYAENLNEKITSKIGLPNTYVGGKTNVKNNESFSYQFINNWKQEPETNMTIPGGAGAIVSTPTELIKFIEALFTLKLVSQKSLDQIKTMTDGYGMGMFQIPFGTKKGYGHNGGIDGFLSNLAYFPQDSMAIAYCTNGVVYPMNDILIGVLSICFNKDYQLPAFNTISFRPENLDKYLGVYTSKQLPIKITITKENATLIAQATGQSSIPLEAVEKDKFTFNTAGINIEFNLEKNELILKQSGGTFLFTRDK